MDAAAFGASARIRAEVGPDSVNFSDDHRSDNAQPSRIPARIARHLAAHRYDAATLIMDLDSVEAQYRRLSAGLDPAQIYYAVKANPSDPVIARLAQIGSHFDVASPGEVDIARRAGATADQISYGNTIKKTRDIAYARAAGVDLFAYDSDEELAKIAEAAPGAGVYCRLLIEDSAADWPLSRKFGCPPEEAVRLLKAAEAMGLRPQGMSFHVGSQAREPGMWRGGLDQAARAYAMARMAGLDLPMLNLGGGFPAEYDRAVPDAQSYSKAVMTLARERFGTLPGRLMAEPGRGLVAEAGVIACEVVLASRKRLGDATRWVYLDIGKFTGLAETMDEAIRYRIETPHDGEAEGPCILAGPTCDSADVLYEKKTIQLPLALKAGDAVRILSAGAYTTSYAAVGFNGFLPPETVCI